MITVRDAIHALEQMPETSILAIGHIGFAGMPMPQRDVEVIQEAVADGRVVIA